MFSVQNDGSKILVLDLKSKNVQIITNDTTLKDCFRRCYTTGELLRIQIIDKDLINEKENQRIEQVFCGDGVRVLKFSRCDPLTPLGFRIRRGLSYYSTSRKTIETRDGIFISKLQPNCLLTSKNYLNLNDEILKVNEKSTCGKDIDEVSKMISNLFNNSELTILDANYSDLHSNKHSDEESHEFKKCLTGIVVDSE